MTGIVIACTKVDNLPGIADYFRLFFCFRLSFVVSLPLLIIEL